MYNHNLIAGELEDDPLVMACQLNDIHLIRTLINRYRNLMDNLAITQAVVDRVKTAITKTQNLEALRVMQEIFWDSAPAPTGTGGTVKQQLTICFGNRIQEFASEANASSGASATTENAAASAALSNVTVITSASSEPSTVHSNTSDESSTKFAEQPPPKSKKELAEDAEKRQKLFDTLPHELMNETDTDFDDILGDIIEHCVDIPFGKYFATARAEFENKKQTFLQYVRSSIKAELPEHAEYKYMAFFGVLRTELISGKDSNDLLVLACEAGNIKLIRSLLPCYQHLMNNGLLEQRVAAFVRVKTAITKTKNLETVRALQGCDWKNADNPTKNSENYCQTITSLLKDQAQKLNTTGAASRESSASPAVALLSDADVTKKSAELVGEFALEVYFGNTNKYEKILNELAGLAELEKPYDGYETPLVKYLITGEANCGALNQTFFEYVFIQDPENDPLLWAYASNNMICIQRLVPCYLKLLEPAETPLVLSSSVRERVKKAVESASSIEALGCLQNCIQKSEIKDLCGELLASIEIKIEALEPEPASQHDEVPKLQNEKRDELFASIKIQTAALGMKPVSQHDDVTKLQNENSSEYSWKNFGYGIAGGVVLVGAFALMTYVVTCSYVSIHENSNLSADKVFNSIANWMWTALCGQPHQPNQAAVAGMLVLSGGLTTLVSGAVGMRVGGKQLPTNNGP